MMRTNIGFISVSAVPDEALDEPPHCFLVNEKLTKARDDEREDMSDNQVLAPCWDTNRFSALTTDVLALTA